MSPTLVDYPEMNSLIRSGIMTSNRRPRREWGADAHRGVMATRASGARAIGWVPIVAGKMDVILGRMGGKWRQAWPEPPAA